MPRWNRSIPFPGMLWLGMAIACAWNSMPANCQTAAPGHIDKNLLNAAANAVHTSVVDDLLCKNAPLGKDLCGSSAPDGVQELFQQVVTPDTVSKFDDDATVMDTWVQQHAKPFVERLQRPVRLLAAKYRELDDNSFRFDLTNMIENSRVDILRRQCEAAGGSTYACRLQHPAIWDSLHPRWGELNCPVTEQGPRNGMSGNFGVPVDNQRSALHYEDGVDVNLDAVMIHANITLGLEPLMKQLASEDEAIRWIRVVSTHGVSRVFPGSAASHLSSHGDLRNSEGFAGAMRLNVAFVIDTGDAMQQVIQDLGRSSLEAAVDVFKAVASTLTGEDQITVMLTGASSADSAVLESRPASKAAIQIAAGELITRGRQVSSPLWPENLRWAAASANFSSSMDGTRNILVVLTSSRSSISAEDAVAAKLHSDDTAWQGQESNRRPALVLVQADTNEVSRSLEIAACRVDGVALGLDPLYAFSQTDPRRQASRVLNSLQPLFNLLHSVPPAADQLNNVQMAISAPWWSPSAAGNGLVVTTSAPLFTVLDGDATPRLSGFILIDYVYWTPFPPTSHLHTLHSSLEALPSIAGVQGSAMLSKWSTGVLLLHSANQMHLQRLMPLLQNERIACSKSGHGSVTGPIGVANGDWGVNMWADYHNVELLEGLDDQTTEILVSASKPGTIRVNSSDLAHSANAFRSFIGKAEDFSNYDNVTLSLSITHYPFPSAGLTFFVSRPVDIHQPSHKTVQLNESSVPLCMPGVQNTACVNSSFASSAFQGNVDGSAISFTADSTSFLQPWNVRGALLTQNVSFFQSHGSHGVLSSPAQGGLLHSAAVGEARFLTKVAQTWMMHGPSATQITVAMPSGIVGLYPARALPIQLSSQINAMASTWSKAADHSFRSVGSQAMSFTWDKVPGLANRMVNIGVAVGQRNSSISYVPNYVSAPVRFVFHVQPQTMQGMFEQSLGTELTEMCSVGSSMCCAISYSGEVMAYLAKGGLFGTAIEPGTQIVQIMPEVAFALWNKGIFSPRVDFSTDIASQNINNVYSPGATESHLWVVNFKNVGNDIVHLEVSTEHSVYSVWAKAVPGSALLLLLSLGTETKAVASPCQNSASCPFPPAYVDMVTSPAKRTFLPASKPHDQGWSATFEVTKSIIFDQGVRCSTSLPAWVAAIIVVGCTILLLGILLLLAKGILLEKWRKLQHSIRDRVGGLLVNPSKDLALYSTLLFEAVDSVPEFYTDREHNLESKFVLAIKACKTMERQEWLLGNAKKNESTGQSLVHDIDGQRLRSQLLAQASVHIRKARRLHALSQALAIALLARRTEVLERILHAMEDGVSKVESIQPALRSLITQVDDIHSRLEPGTDAMQAVESMAVVLPSSPQAGTAGPRRAIRKNPATDGHESLVDMGANLIGNVANLFSGGTSLGAQPASTHDRGSVASRRAKLWEGVEASYATLATSQQQGAPASTSSLSNLRQVQSPTGSLIKARWEGVEDASAPEATLSKRKKNSEEERKFYEKNYGHVVHFTEEQDGGG